MVNTAAEFPAEKLREYFSFKYRGKFYNQMKYLVAKDLRSQGNKLQYIASIIYGNELKHDCVINLFKSIPGTVDIDVEKAYLSWIQQNVYPISFVQNRKPKDEFEMMLHKTRGALFNERSFKLMHRLD